jgi:hypothetical protein
MPAISRNHRRAGKAHSRAFAFLLIVLACPLAVPAQNEEIARKLERFDQYMDEILKDWNAPGMAVGVVAKDQLVFAKGYGYRDYGQKLPMTPDTMFQIASNTKLFTAVAVGLLVEEAKLEWDKPVRQYVPAIQFCNDELNKAVTIRDMLAHRTGVTRHDMIWYKSDFTRKELFERLWGKWSVNFGTNPQGDVDKAVMSLDEGEVTFTRRPTALDPNLVWQLTGTYETPTGVKFQVVGRDDEGLFLVFSGQQPEKLIAYKGLQFRTQRFSDFIFEFVMDNGQVTALKQKSPVGEYTFPRK